jgi:hypothetical protein
MAFGKRGLLFLLLAGGTIPAQVRGAELVGLVREAGTGETIIGASVRAIPISKNPREVFSITNNSGRYHLELLKGKYRLFLSFPGSDYLPQFFSSNDQTQGEIIDVPTFDSFRIIDLTMISGGAIEGKVVRFSDNNPLPNIRITASSLQFRTSVTTRSDGSYAFRALPPGNYRVQAIPLNENFIPVYYGEVRDAEKSTLLPVERKQTQTHIDFRLRNGGMVSGRVYANKNREPVAGIKVIAENLSVEERPPFAVTDSQGFYSLRGLSPGEYILETQAPSEAGDSVKPTRSYLMQYHSGRSVRELADKLEIESGSVLTGISFALVEGGSLSGKVRSRYHNAPLGGVTVIPRENSKDFLVGPTAKTDLSGDYKVADLPPGDYLVGLSLPMSVRRLVNHYFRDKLNVELADKISLEEGGKVQRIDFNLPLGATLQGKMTIEGDHYPTRNVNKTLRFDRISADLDGFGRREFKLDPDGGFVIEGTPAGRYAVTPLTDDPNIVPQSDSLEKTLDIAEGDLLENLEFNMKIAGSIGGTIVFEGKMPEFEKYEVLVVNMKDQSRKYFGLSSEQFLLTGLDQGTYLLFLLSRPEKMPSSEELSMPVLYDTHLVEVQRGKTISNISLHLNRELSFPLGINR